MKDNKGTSRREFLKMTAGSSAIIMSGFGRFTYASPMKTRKDYNVFSQGSIGKLRLKNRFVKAATATAATTEDCTFLNGGVDMYRNWSKGGAGLIITGHMTVAPIPRDAFHHAPTCIYDDTFIPQLRKIADAVHQEDSSCKIIAQINHIGRASRVNPIGPSAQRQSTWKFWQAKKPGLSKNEIQEIIRLFVAAARRAYEAGFDGVELHAGPGFLLQAFLSPFSNSERADEYGGSLSKRVRIIREIVEGIKTSIAVDFPVLIKTNCDDGKGEDGTNIENFPRFANELASTRLDAIEITGANASRQGLDTPEEQSYFAKYAENLHVNIPIILTGGNKNIDVIENLSQQGKIDFFGFARPFVREPNLPNRWLNMVGTAECECISCNRCLKYLIAGNKLVSCQLL